MNTTILVMLLLAGVSLVFLLRLFLVIPPAVLASPVPPVLPMFLILLLVVM